MSQEPRPKHLVIIMSDEHDPRCMGINGHPVVQTPNLDALARNALRFRAASTPSPICVPARAALATGRYVNAIGNWDNAMPYDGRVPSWGHVLRRHGVRVDSVGKLHYRGAADDTGFDHQYLPMHVHGGKGQVWGSVRHPLPDINHTARPRMFGPYIGEGESAYTSYDRAVARQATDWLDDAATRDPQAPWVLFVSFVAPHFPLVAPAEFARMYRPEDMPRGKLLPEDGFARHPWAEAMHRFWPHDETFIDAAERQRAVAMYFALCSFMDHNVGLIRDAIAAGPFAANTAVMYFSDHGDNLGARGLWGKSTLYQESVAVPLLLSVPGRAPAVIDTPASLVDVYPTVLDIMGIHEPADPAMAGRSLLAPPDPARAVLSEYHAVGAPSAAFMVRKGAWKYHHYIGYPPELFDLAADPEETRNLADDPAHASVLAEMRGELRKLCDPDAVDARVRADQAMLVDRFGGRDEALDIGGSGATPVPA